MRKILTVAKSGVSGLLNLVYPPTCGICDKKLPDAFHQNLSVCEECLLKVKKNPPPYCLKCGRSLSGAAENVEVCWECSGKKFHYDRSWSCFLYEGVVKDALHLLKYSGRLSLSNLFSGLLVQFLKNNPAALEGVDALVAVPLHSARLRERDFNQAGILAGAVSGEFKIKNISGCLKRTVVTKPQSELDKKERLENVKGAFRVVFPTLLYGNSVLVIDDLFTTGATLNECGRVLKKAGAAKVRCLTFARGAN